ncbi:MAG: NAD(P)H-dependent oxidoreductase [Ignavibacteriae bacterium]|nr:MAG: NAD(P)H-dependent oxidoreductase [Ignavibacteriota bacterium]
MKNKTLNILAIAGSMRSESYNRKALQTAKHIATEFNANVTELDLKTLDLPLYNEDLRAHGFPESVVELKNAVASADVLLIATPEYNHSIPGVLKNAIDWASDETNPFEGKTAAIFGASKTMVGTLRSQLHLRQVLGALSVELVPQPQVFIRSARTAFQPDGSFVDPNINQQLSQLIEATLALAYRKQESRTE